jgi:glycosyltransferase involved in cell wall biosynthesis
MSLLQIVHALYPQSTGGVEIYTLEVARRLGGAVLTFRPAPAAPSEWSGLRVLTRGERESAHAAVLRALDEVAPSVVLVQHLGAVGPGALFALRERGIPYAVFLHDFTALCPTHKLWHRVEQLCAGPGRLGVKCALCVSGSWKRAIEVPFRIFQYRHRPEQWQVALGSADVLIANSRFLRDFWIDQGAPPERVAVISPVMPTARADAQTAPATRAEAALFYAGGWGEAKGARLLASTLEHVSQPVTLVVAGATDGFAQRQFREHIPQRHSFSFTGVLAPTDLRQALSNATAAVVPSRWDETYSRMLHESQAAGVPVAATAVGGIPERTIHGLNGFLARPDDPLSLATAIEEALAAEWDGEQARRAALDEAESAAAQLTALLAAVERRCEAPALELEFAPLIAAMSAQLAMTREQVRVDLVATLRGESEASPELVRAAAVGHRQRLLNLNHAAAYFRRADCRTILDVDAGVGDAARWFARWGFESRAEEHDPQLRAIAQALGVELVRDGFAPDAGFLNAADPNGTVAQHITDLRRRYPSLRAIAQETSSGVEIL